MLLSKQNDDLFGKRSGTLRNFMKLDETLWNFSTGMTERKNHSSSAYDRTLGSRMSHRIVA